MLLKLPCIIFIRKMPQPCLEGGAVGLGGEPVDQGPSLLTLTLMNNIKMPMSNGI